MLDSFYNETLKECLKKTGNVKGDVPFPTPKGLNEALG